MRFKSIQQSFIEYLWMPVTGLGVRDKMIITTVTAATKMIITMMMIMILIVREAPSP